MDRQKLQRALLDRGIRLTEDDPMFVMLELNEMMFNEVVENHMQTLDRNAVVELVSSVLARLPERKPQPRQICSIEMLDHTVNRLIEVADQMGSYQSGVINVSAREAKETAEIVAAGRVKGMSVETMQAMERFKQLLHETSSLSDHAKSIALSAQTLQSMQTQAERNILRTSVIWSSIFLGGIFFGGYIAILIIK
jgi:hypothetical protein